MSQALPANPNLDWLRKTAKQRLAELRAVQPNARLHQAQLAVARDYGFKSWRALKAHVESTGAVSSERDSTFEAARAGDIDAVRNAVAAGFDPAAQDADGRTILQIAKDRGHDALELMVRDIREHIERSEDEAAAVRGIIGAAQGGDVDDLRRRLDAHPELIDALGGAGFQKAAPLHMAALRSRHAAVRLLVELGADLDRRDFPDNATPLHLAAVAGDLETVRLLVEAGSDIDAGGDDYEVGVLGWATCFREVRDDVAGYLLSRGAKLGLWAAIALDRVDDMRAMVGREPSLLAARMSRNQHRRTPLHHAAAKNRARIVKLLLGLGADPSVVDATGATALTTASQENADAAIVAELLAAGTRLDFLTAVNLGRYGEAEVMLRNDPARIGPEGGDTIALHLAVSKKNLASIRWLVAHGIAVNAKRTLWGCNHTALHMTMESGTIEIAHLLLDAGAEPDIRDDKFHATALGWAEYFGRENLAALIRERGGGR